MGNVRSIALGLLVALVCGLLGVGPLAYQHSTMTPLQPLFTPAHWSDLN